MKREGRGGVDADGRERRQKRTQGNEEVQRGVGAAATVCGGDDETEGSKNKEW